MGKRATPESDICQQLVAWYDERYPEYRDLLIHVPNGMPIIGPAWVRAAIMKRMKAEGLRPATPDYFLAMPTYSSGGLWIEMKAPGNYPRPEQKARLNLLHDAGYIALWYSSLDSAQTRIDIHVMQHNLWRADRDAEVEEGR